LRLFRFGSVNLAVDGLEAAPVPTPALDLGLNMDIDGGFGALDSDDDLGDMDGYDMDGGEGDMTTMAVPQVGA
jgi:hypothetical protein